MKKIKAPKAKNVQPVILTQDTLIALVKEIELLKNKISILEKKHEEVMDIASGAYPERTENGLTFNYYTEKGEIDSVHIKA